MNIVRLSCKMAASLSILACTACAPVVEGGPRLSLAPAFQENVRVRDIVISSGWLRSESDFADTFTEEVREELKRCANGAAVVDVRIHVDKLARADRLQMILNGGGEHMLSGTVEFVDPERNNIVVGRFPVSVTVRHPGGFTGVVADRQLVASKAFGRAICEEAFGEKTGGPRDQPGEG